MNFRYRAQGGRGGRFADRWRNESESRRNPQSSRGLQRKPDWRRIATSVAVAREKSFWFVFTLCETIAADLAVIFKYFHSLAGARFTPLFLRCNANDKTIEFTILDQTLADLIYQKSGWLKFENGKKVRIKRSTIKTRPLLDGVQKELIKQVMSKRYIAETKELNLSDFQNDPGFTEYSVDFPLTRVGVLVAVIDILKQNTPEVVTLNLSNNRLNNCDVPVCFLCLLPNLKKLIVDNNKFSAVVDFQKISFWSLEELSLLSNPINDDLSNHQLFRSLRGIFPTLKFLNGQPELSFIELPTVGNLTMKGSFLYSESVGNMMSAFLTQYFSILDSPELENRNNLIDAYDPNKSCFTVCIENSSTCKNTRPLARSWRKVIRRCHNIVFYEAWKNRTEMVELCGSMSITCFLKDVIPETRHDPGSIVLDFNIIAQNQALCLISGFFKDPNDDRDCILHFHMATILECFPDRSIKVLNEMLYVSPSNSETLFEFLRHLEMANLQHEQQLAATAAVVGTSPIPSLQQMIDQFSNMTGMRADWSEKCLSENQWQFEKAYQIFVALNAQGKVPAEAFNAHQP